MFQGPANAFPYGTEDISMLPATEYVLWYVPVSSAGTYVLEDFVEYVFVTPDITADASVAAPSFSIYDVKASGFAATVTPAASYYKTYAAVMKSTGDAYRLCMLISAKSMEIQSPYTSVPLK